jgi:hypothetical protein
MRDLTPAPGGHQPHGSVEAFGATTLLQRSTSHKEKS